MGLTSSAGRLPMSASVLRSSQALASIVGLCGPSIERSPRRTAAAKASRPIHLLVIVLISIGPRALLAPVISLHVSCSASHEQGTHDGDPHAFDRCTGYQHAHFLGPNGTHIWR